MNFLKNTKHLIRVLAFALTLFAVQFASAAEFCAQVLNYQLTSLSELKQRALEKSSQYPQAKYTNPKSEIQFAQKWDGSQGPKLLNDLLPDGLKFIDHSLPLANEEGVIKTNTGYMAHLRAQVRGIGTNMGVNVNALMDNFNRPNKSVVRESAKAVVVFIHGGGTKTTGHHVAVSLMNYLHSYNVDVVSIDMPWHGEGPRTSFSEVKGSLELLREYVQKYIAPSGKPVILAGHSMGGVISDLYMRMYPRDTLFKAVIPLSTVADSVPGGTPEQKMQREQLIAEHNRKNPMIPAEERELGEALARQNKISPVCGMYCQMIMFGLDWTVPAHKGKEYLPALYIIGRGDALYQGFEGSFKSAVGDLENVTLKIYEKRRDLKDKDASTEPSEVGHLIFDHKPMVEFSSEVTADVRKKVLAGTLSEKEFNELRAQGKIRLDPEFKLQDLAEPETFVLMRKFIGKVIAQDVETKVKPQSDAFTQVVQAYANNLVFREFAKSYIYQHSRATEKGSQLGSELNSIGLRIRDLSSKQKKGDELSANESMELQELFAKQKLVKGLLSGSAIVEGPNARAFAELQSQLQILIGTEISNLNSRRKETKTQFDEQQNEANRLEKALLSLEANLSSPKLEKLRHARESLFKALMKQDMVVRLLTESYLVNSYSNGKFKEQLFETMPAENVQAFERYERLSNAYQTAVVRFNKQLLLDARAGQLETRNLNLELIVPLLPKNIPTPTNSEQFLNAVQIVVQNMLNAKSAAGESLLTLKQQEKELAQLASQVFSIEEKKAQLAGEDYFVLEHYTVEGLLGRSLTEARADKENLNNLLQKMWSEWQKLWADRTTAGS